MNNIFLNIEETNTTSNNTTNRNRNTRYNHSKIYKIRRIDGFGLCYIGSTTEKYLSTRYSYHKSAYNRYKDGLRNQKYSLFQLFDEYRVENCIIELIELFNCNSKDELKVREGFYIVNTDNCVNKNVAGRSQQEYYGDNREKKIEYQKEYYYIKKYKQKFKECLKELLHSRLVLKDE